MTGLTVEQVNELAELLDVFIGGWQPRRGRRRVLSLTESLMMTLFYVRHNACQQVVGAVFGVSQPTVSRVMDELTEPLLGVLDAVVPELVEVVDGQVVVLDGTLVATGNRTGRRELYSGKRHRSGVTVQVLCDLRGRLLHVGVPMPGSTHDLTAFRQTGLAAVLEEPLAEQRVFGDLGYYGDAVVTAVKKPRGGELSPRQMELNKEFNGMRAVVERCIAHLKNWRVLATGYRCRLAKLERCLQLVTALEFYRLSWSDSE
jgi:hypothetical protein